MLFNNSKKERISRKYMLKGIIKDHSWVLLTACTKKETVYYMSQYHSSVKVNVNEKVVYEKIEEYLKESDFENKTLTRIDQDIILDLLKLQEQEKWHDIIQIEKDIEKLIKKQDNLLDMKLDWIISKEKYLEKNNHFEQQIHTLEKQKKTEKSDDFEEKTKQMFELAGSFYRSYKWVDLETKTEIIKKLFSSVCLNSKKELQIEDNPILKSS